MLLIIAQTELAYIPLQGRQRYIVPCFFHRVVDTEMYLIESKCIAIFQGYLKFKSNQMISMVYQINGYGIEPGSYGTAVCVKLITVISLEYGWIYI